MGKRRILFNQKTQDEIGFGAIVHKDHRLISRNGELNIERHGLGIRDLYSDLLQMSWMKFMLLLFSSFLIINFVCAIGFLIIGVENIQGVEPGSIRHNWAESFFFSMQTFTTVGYGALHPVGLPANILASAIAFIGILWTALVTGLSFARFARPNINIMFSKKLLISPYNTGNALMFRIVNGSRSQLRDLEARVTLSWLEDEGGEAVRKFKLLDLELDKILLFPLNWTIVHPITESSPLHETTQELCNERGFEFIISIKAFDETYSEYIQVIHSYLSEDLLWDHRFKRMYYEGDQGIVLRLDWLDEIEKVNS